MWYALTVFFLISLCLGSFFNVVIYRMPRGLPVSHPPSACPKCKNFIKWYDNVPVFGWIGLRGKCRQCKNPISIQYPLVELLTGLLGVLGPLWVFYDQGELNYPAALKLSWLLIACVPIMAIDFKHYLIPDIIVLPGFLFAVGISFSEGFMVGIWSALGGILSALGLWLFTFLMSKVLKKEAMGFGDIKLLLMLGALNGISYTLPTLVLASIFGMIYFVALKILQRIKEGEEGMVPFGPFLLMGALVVHIRGEELLNSYLDWVMKLTF